VTLDQIKHELTRRKQDWDSIPCVYKYMLFNCGTILHTGLELHMHVMSSASDSFIFGGISGNRSVICCL